jgi:hypothetical protein
MNQSQPVDDRAIVSLIAGLVSVMFAWFYFAVGASWVCLPTGLLAVVTGIPVLREGKGGRSLAVTGIVLGTIGICSWILARML